MSRLRHRAAAKPAHRASVGVGGLFAAVIAGLLICWALPAAALAVASQQITITAPGAGATLQADASASTTISWSTSIAPSGGSFAVSAVESDGTSTSLGSVDTVDDQSDYSLPWAIEQAAGRYTIKVVWQSGGDSAQSTSGPITLMTDDPLAAAWNNLLTYPVSYGWATVSDTSASGGGYSVADLLDSPIWDPSGGIAPSLAASKRPQLVYRFYGDSVTWIYEETPASGLARITIDGLPWGTVDQYAPTTVYQAQTAISSLGADEYHTIRIIANDTRNTASSGYGITHDAFLACETPSDTSARLDEDASGGRALYGWATAQDSSAHGGAYAFSDAPGASTSFSFTGDSLTWLYGMGPREGKADVFIDGSDEGTIDQYAPSLSFPAAGLVGDGLQFTSMPRSPTGAPRGQTAAGRPQPGATSQARATTVS